MSDETSSKDLLLEMGFPLEKIVQALVTTGSTEIEELIAWMENNEVYETIPSASCQVYSSTEVSISKDDIKDTTSNNFELNQDLKSESQDSSIINVKMLKCNICQKLLKTDDLAAIHTAKTGHTDFQESQEELKPLTDEEKKAKVVELQEAIAKRRHQKEEQEKGEAFKKEQERRKQGKEYMNLREQIRDQEMMKLAEERKREKMEDRMAKERIKDLIERDKMERMKKFNYRESDSADPQQQQQQQQQQSNGDQNGHPKGIASPLLCPVQNEEQPTPDYQFCDLQIRLNNGKVLKQTFGAKEALAAVKLFVTMNRAGGGNVIGGAEPFTLMTSFPKKVFSDDDMAKPLSDLGLVPKAVLIVTKKPFSL